jgi:hypothetical protein
MCAEDVETVVTNGNHDDDVDEMSDDYVDESNELGNCDLSTVTEVKLEPDTSEAIGTLFDQLLEANNRSSGFSEYCIVVVW